MDNPAPRSCTPAFMGLPNSIDRVQFTAGHPFNEWKQKVNSASCAESGSPRPKPPGLKDETATLALGNGVFTVFGLPYQPPSQQGGIEGFPHGTAHTSYGSGSIIDSLDRAARSVCFFCSHGNVDRLWARWQWFYKRTQDTDPNSFYNGAPVQVGHNLGDTMWPWNGATRPHPPNTAPGGPMPSSAMTTAPGPTPTVRSMLDYQGVNGGAFLGFDYDDVPFEMPAPAVA